MILSLMLKTRVLFVFYAEKRPEMNFIKKTVCVKVFEDSWYQNICHLKYWS